MGNQLFAAVLGLDLALQRESFSNCQSNLFLIHFDGSCVCCCSLFHGNMHAIGFGNVNLSSFHHLISCNKIFIFTVFLQFLMGYGKFSVFDSSYFFIIYASVTVTPVNIIACCTSIFLPGKGNTVLLSFSFCKKCREFQSVNVLSFHFGLVSLLDCEGTFLKCNPVIRVGACLLGNCDRIGSHFFTSFSFHVNSGQGVFSYQTVCCIGKDRICPANDLLQIISCYRYRLWSNGYCNRFPVCSIIRTLSKRYRQSCSSCTNNRYSSFFIYSYNLFITAYIRF